MDSSLNIVRKFFGSTTFDNKFTNEVWSVIEREGESHLFAIEPVNSTHSKIVRFH